MFVVIGTYKAFKKLSRGKKISSKMQDAIKTYLDTGGVLKMKDIPFKMVYPSKSRLRKILANTERKEKYIDTQISCWKRTDERAKKPNTFGTKVNTAANPIYWKHLAQMASDKKYRKSFEIVDPPMEMMHEPRYKKMIEMFVKNPEYRERMVEARTSILGKLREPLRATTYKTFEFKRHTAGIRLKKLQLEKGSYSVRKEALKVLIENSGTFF